MSRSISVCLRAVVALVALFGTSLSSPAPVLAATGMLNMETPLQESPAHEAPLIALLPEGAVVSIDGPPVDGFYPVTAGDLSGWMRGETLSVEKDIVAEGSEVNFHRRQNRTDWPLPSRRLTVSRRQSRRLPQSTRPRIQQLCAGSRPTEMPRMRRRRSPLPTSPMTMRKNRRPTRPRSRDPAAEPAPVGEPTKVESRSTDSAALESTVETIGAATPVPVASASETPVGAVAEPTPDASPTPSPTPEPEPVGPASVTVNAPIRTGPGPRFDLIFTVPMGSTVQQTGHVTDGYVTVQYKEVTGWLALEDLGVPSSFIQETPPAETVAPVETTPVEMSPVATEPVEVTPAAPESVPSKPVEVKTPRPGSGAAFTTVDMSLRAGPSASEEPVTIVPAGSRVSLTGVMEGGFQRVTYNEEIGWIADEYLETPADPKPETDRTWKFGVLPEADRAHHLRRCRPLRSIQVRHAAGR